MFKSIHFSVSILLVIVGSIFALWLFTTQHLLGLAVLLLGSGVFSCLFLLFGKMVLQRSKEAGKFNRHEIRTAIQAADCYLLYDEKGELLAIPFAHELGIPSEHQPVSI